MTLRQICESITAVKYGSFEKLIADLSLDCSNSDLREESESILDKYLSNIEQNPIIDVVAGIPYSGKSLYISNMRAINSLVISFDDIMEKLSIYKKLSEESLQVAFEKTELLARIIGYELLCRAVENKCRIIFEHSSAIERHVELYSQIINQSYKLNFVYLKVSTETSCRRSEEFDRKRYTPLAYIQDRYENLMLLLPKYKSLSTNFKIIENE